MAHQYIKQPDGLFAQYSTVTDSFNMWDATEDELITLAREQAAARAERDVREVLADVKVGNVRGWNRLSWKEAVKNHNKHVDDPKHRITIKKPCSASK